MPVLKSEFKPAWWLKNPHLQTIWPTLFRSRPSLEQKKERIELDDGDFIDLSWCGPDNAPVVLILHGLEGSLDSHYAPGLIKRLNDSGFRTCFMYFRSCSNEPNRLPRGYHSGESNDLNTIVQHITDNTNHRVFAIVGFSLGGNVLLKWLGEADRSSAIHTAIAISVPFELAHAGQRLEKGFSRFYQKHLVSQLLKKYRDKQSVHEILNSINLDNVKTFYEFDDVITAPLHGFKNANDYYRKCSSHQFLQFIQQPTLLIHAKDDPFMWNNTSPNSSSLSSSTVLELSDHGGHAGFITGRNPFCPVYWHEQRIIDWLLSHRASG